MSKKKKNLPDDAEIELVRLSPAVPPAAFEDALRALAPELVGSLLTPLPGDWHALAGDVTPALLLGGRSAGEALAAAGAIDHRRVGAAASTEIHALRDAQARAASALAPRALGAAAGDSRTSSISASSGRCFFFFDMALAKGRGGVRPGSMPTWLTRA